MTHLSNWREESDLFEVVTGKMTDEKALKKVDEKKGIKNKVVINPKLTEAIKELGGELIEATEEDENGDENGSVKKPEDQQKKQIENKQKRAQMIKKQVLMKKLIAVRQGAEDIVASHHPKGKVIAENALEKRAKENEKARKWLKKDAKKSGWADIALKASMSKGAGVSEGVVGEIKKGVKRHKDAVEKKKIKNRKAVPYAALAAEHKPEGQVVSEKVKGQDTEMRKMAAQDRAAGKDKRLSPKEGRRSVKPVNYRKEEVLDELSKRTLGNYVKDASSDAAMTSMTHGNKPLAKDAPKREKKILKRLSGIRKATDKLSKEEVVLEKDLNAAERRALPNKDFALPGKGKGPEGKQAGSYPIPDEKHARSALSLVSQHGTPEEKAKVRAKVKKKFPDIQQEGFGASYAVGAGLNAVGEIAKAYGASQAAKGAIVGGALSGAGALAGGALNYAASRNNKKNASKSKKTTSTSKKKVSESRDKALDFVRQSILKKHGKGAIYDPKKKQSPEDKAKVAAERKKRQDADNKAFADRAKKAGYKSTQDYANVVARYGSEDNMKKGRGLGT